MTKILKPLIFFGTENFSLPSLQALIDGGFDIRAVVTKPDSRRGRGQKLASPSVKILAEKYKIPVWQPNDIAEIKDKIKSIKNVAGVLVAYGKIIPEDFLELFNPGIINVHPSLLPRYRGPSPIEAAILNGDSSTGISLIKLTNKMDAGPLYHQIKIDLLGHEARPDLYDKLANLGAQTLISQLSAILEKQLTPTEQDEKDATYCQLLKKADGILDTSKLDAISCERRVRAYLGFPRSRLEIHGQSCVITKVHVVNKASQAHLIIKCRGETFLSIDKLIAPSGKLLDAEEFLRGYPKLER